MSICAILRPSACCGHPIYYYVKRKGSLVNQGMNISRVIRMKLMVFEYCNNFYKHVLDEEDYEKYRFQIYRFLVDSAGDGTVFPSILGRVKRLGEERTVVFQKAVREENGRKRHLEILLQPAASLLEEDFQAVRRDYLLRNNKFVRRCARLSCQGEGQGEDTLSFLTENDIIHSM